MRLFFYGTLIAGSGNPFAAQLHARLDPGRRAHALGTLHAVADPLGWYPAFVPDPAGGKVHGVVHETAPDFAEADLAELDHYELYFPQEPQRSDFVRRTVTVHVPQAGLAIDAQAYVWARPVDANMLAIPSGDFRLFLAERGEAAFGASAG